MQAEPRATGLKAIVYNRSAFPARALTTAKFRPTTFTLNGVACTVS